MHTNVNEPNLNLFYPISKYASMRLLGVGNIKLRKGLDTVESLSVEGKGSKTLGKIFLVL